MSSTNVQISIPFESLIESVKNLSAKEKRLIWEVIEKQLGQYEEEQLEQDPEISQQIADAREAYRSGDYQSLDDYVAQRKDKKK
ncbi:MAG: hypothetical protein ACE5HO_08540 [bacterium]